MSVALTDGRSISLQLDSASTSAEVCQAVADRVNLQDTLGFSLFITFQDKVRSSVLLPMLPQSQHQLVTLEVLIRYSVSRRRPWAAAADM